MHDNKPKQFELFIGMNTSSEQNLETKEFFLLYEQLHKLLGEEPFLLDDYLYQILKAINSKYVNTATMDGFYAYSELFKICDAITERYPENHQKQHPFYDRAKEFIDSHTFPYHEITNFHLYVYFLSGDFLTYRLDKYLTIDCYHRLEQDFDMAEINRLYEKLDATLKDKTLLQKFNDCISEVFVQTSISQAFTQGFQSHVTPLLSEKDVETGKYLFQLVLEQKHFYGDSKS